MAPRTALAPNRPRSRPDKALPEEEWIARRLNGVTMAIRQGREDEVRALIDEIIDWEPQATAPIEMAAAFATRNEDWADLLRYRAALSAAEPNNRLARIALIRALLDAGATAAALDLAARALERQPIGAGFRRLRLQALLADGDIQGAAELSGVMAGAPADDSAAFMADVALILAQGGGGDLAEEWLARARSIHGDHADLARVAEILADQSGRWEMVPRERSSADGPDTDGRADEELDREAWIDRRQNQVMAAIGEGDEARVRSLIDEVIARAPRAASPIELAARFADRNGDWANLVVYRTALVAARPGDRRAKVALVRALVRIKSTSEALALVDQLLKDDPVGAGFRRLRLEVLLAAGDTRAAIEQWRALAANPAEESVNYVSEVAQILAEAGQYRMATDWVAGAQRRHGNPPALARLIATFAYRAGAWDEAERLWRDLAETGDDNTRKAAGIFRARIATGAGRMVDATAHYREAFKNDEANEEAARHLVRVAIAEGRLETAAGLIGRLEGRAGRTAMATGLKARLAMARGDSTAALTEFRQGLADHPADVDLRRGLADLYGHLGDYDSMDEVLAAAEALAPRDPAILSRRLTAGANRLAPPAQLLAIADRLLALRPHDQGVLRQKANLLIRLGERREAVAVLIEAIDRGPSNVSAWTAVISNLLTLNDGEQAAAFVERARRVFSGQSAGDLLALAEILESGDLGGEAAGLAERAVALAPDSGAARVTAARLWEGRGLYRRAWPHLLALRDLDAAPGRGTLTFARVARALSYVDAHPVAGAENDQFPDAVFDRIARLARPRPVAGTEPMVFQVTSSLAAGGSERQVALTIQGLAAAPDALRPELVAQDMNPLTARDFFLPIVEATGAPVWVLAEMRGEGLVREAATAGAGARGDLGLLGALPTDVANVALPLYSLIAERRPRAVHLWQDAIVVAGGIAAMLAGVPRIVLSTRSTRPIERQRARPYLKAGYDALLRYPGTVMLNNSKNGARDYADWLAIDPARIGTLYNGFVFDELRARADPILTAEIRRRLAAGKEDVVIGGIMRCSFEKRPDLWADTVIDLAGRDPRVRGLLVGEGPMRAELQEKATSLGLGDKIQFVGRQTPVESWIGAMDLLFLSSVTEGLPNVLIEAQALGVAVATMRVGGAPETVVENQTALVIDEGSAAEVAQAMAPLVFDPARREQFGAAGVSWTRATFGLDAAMARLSAIYAEDGPAR